MSTEPNNNEQNNESSQPDQWNKLSSDDLLKTRVESETVVNFIENMVQAMGQAAAGQYGATLPQNQIRRPVVETARKYQSKTVNTIMQKLERVEKYPDTAKDLLVDQTINEWLSHNGCKQKEYYDELECAQELTGFFAGHRYFDHAVKSASKAVTMTLLHRKDDLETLAELYWVLADIHAATDKMSTSMDYMRKCLELMEPGADESHPTYKELHAQLEETRQRSLMVVTA